MIRCARARKVKKMVDKYACLDEEKKTAKAVRILKSFFNVSKVVVKKGIAAYKWANENVSTRMAVTIGLIIILGSAFISNYLSAVF